MSEHLGDAAELLLEDPISHDDFAGALANGDLAALVRRALDPGDGALVVVGWPGRRLDRPLARGDLVIRGARDAAPRLAVVGDAQLLDRASARRQALVTAAPLPGGYVRTIEPAGVAHGGRFARRLTGPDGLLLPGVTIIRAVGENAETVASPSPRPTVRQGSSGPAVADAQARLNAIHSERTAARQTGLDRCPLIVDGRFGPNTRGAVVAFQRVAFPSAPNEWDGVVGPRTWAALGGSETEGPVLPTRCPGLAPSEIIDHFDFNSSQVLPRHQPKIVGIARCVIESRRTATPITTQTIIGHTDHVGSDTDNDALGLRRAEAVKAEILAAIRRITGGPARLAITTDTHGRHEPVPGDDAASRRVEVITPVRVAPPPPARAATIQFVLDDDDDHLVDGRSPVATALMFGLWDQAYNAAGNVRNAAAETANFVGLDRRRFYLRVNDPGAAGSTVQAQWKTLTAGGADDDAPASLAVTLTETASGSKIFVSRALMLVTDDTDVAQSTHSGLTSGPDAGVRTRGQSNHRLRRAALDGSVTARYAPGGGAAAVSITRPVFARSPESRRRLDVRVVNYDSHATAAQIAAHFAAANRRWAQTGLRIDPGATENRALPNAAKDPDGSGRYGGSIDNDQEVAALADLIAPADNTLTVVFVQTSAANAYTTLFRRTRSALGQRFFVFINPGLAPAGDTLGHELHHVLNNRPDTGDDVTNIDFRRFFSFNTNPSAGYGLAVPDVRVRRRIHTLHSTDPNNDPSNNNTFNWMRRARTQRFPFPNALDAPDASTGNTLTRTL